MDGQNLNYFTGKLTVSNPWPLSKDDVPRFKKFDAIMQRFTRNSHTLCHNNLIGTIMGFAKNVSSLIDNNTKTENLGHGKARFEHFCDRGYGQSNYVVPEVCDNIGDCLESVEFATSSKHDIAIAEQNAFKNINKYLAQIFLMSIRCSSLITGRFSSVVDKYTDALSVCGKYVLRVIKTGLTGIWDAAQDASKKRHMTFVNSQDVKNADGVEQYFNSKVIDKSQCNYADYSVKPYIEEPFSNSLAPSWSGYDSRLFAWAKRTKDMRSNAAKHFADTIRDRIENLDPYNDDWFMTEKKSYVPERVNMAAFPEHEMSSAFRTFREHSANVDEEYDESLEHMGTDENSDSRSENLKRRTRLCSIMDNVALINEMKSNMPSVNLYVDCGIPRGMAYEDSILGVQKKIADKIDQALVKKNMAYLFDDWKQDYHKTLYDDVTNNVVWQNSNKQPDRVEGDTDFTYYYRLNRAFLPIQDERFSQICFYQLDRYVYRKAPIDKAASFISSMSKNTTKGMLASKTEPKSGIVDATKESLESASQYARGMVDGVKMEIGKKISGITDAAGKAISKPAGFAAKVANSAATVVNSAYSTLNDTVGL